MVVLVVAVGSEVVVRVTEAEEGGLEKEEETGAHPSKLEAMILHGGPHDVSLSYFSKYLVFLSSVGYNLLIV
ncbi:hypothetical protein AAZV13_18G107400 [Glycine max]|uniref:Uncharacterized protein n=1 Tax=Glycine soja TaxID=3848 RepID=A0A445FST1_GLYSO|nr:hypothetical protein D0Y65_048350 [Glycine soja]